MYKNNRLALVLALVFMITFGAGILLGKTLEIGIFNESIAQKASKGKTVNILVMGIDARSAQANSRSDTMILVSVDRTTNKVAMVWIPRDTRVEVGLNRYDKINSVNLVKGPDAACDVVGKLLGTKVKYYVVVNFNGFAKIVDILGGIEIDVETNMRHYDPNPKLSINLTKGKQYLNGEDALRYVRYRGGPTADIGRTQRQQKFIKAFAKEMLKPKNIIKLPKLLPEVSKHVNTNIPADDMLYMVNIAREFEPEDMITQTLPGYPFTDPKSLASYWEADKDIAQGIIQDLLAGKTYDVAQDPPDWVKPAPVIYKEENSENSEQDDEESTAVTEGDTSTSDLDEIEIPEQENIPYESMPTENNTLTGPEGYIPDLQEEEPTENLDTSIVPSIPEEENTVTQ